MKKINNDIPWKQIDEFFIYECFVCGTFEKNNRKYLLTHIDFEEEEIGNEVKSYTYALAIKFHSELDYAKFMDRKISELDLLNKNESFELYCNESNQKTNTDGKVEYSNDDKFVYLCTLPKSVIPLEWFPHEESFLCDLWMEEDEIKMAKRVSEIYEKYEKMNDLINKIYESDAFTIEQAYKDFCTDSQNEDLNHGNV